MALGAVLSRDAEPSNQITALCTARWRECVAVSTVPEVIQLVIRTAFGDLGDLSAADLILVTMALARRSTTIPHRSAATAILEPLRQHVQDHALLVLIVGTVLQPKLEASSRTKVA